MTLLKVVSDKDVEIRHVVLLRHGFMEPPVNQNFFSNTIFLKSSKFQRYPVHYGPIFNCILDNLRKTAESKCASDSLRTSTHFTGKVCQGQIGIRFFFDAVELGISPSLLVGRNPHVDIFGEL